jgi:retron-type reverse transcriptase
MLGRQRTYWTYFWPDHRGHIHNMKYEKINSSTWVNIEPQPCSHTSADKTFCSWQFSEQFKEFNEQFINCISKWQYTCHIASNAIDLRSVTLTLPKFLRGFLVLKITSNMASSWRYFLSVLPRNTCHGNSALFPESNALKFLYFQMKMAIWQSKSSDTRMVFLPHYSGQIFVAVASYTICIHVFWQKLIPLSYAAS